MKKLRIACVSLLGISSLGVQASSTATNALEEVVVTAQKRTENDKRVPVFVALMNEEKIENVFSSGEDIRSLSGQVPGLYIESSNGRIAPRFYLRGLGNVDFDLAASQPVSYIYDDVVLENVILKSSPVFDVQSVEVLKGPQGTLFGRNTTAGVVKFTSKRPTKETDLESKISYGTFDSVNFETALGGTLIDNILLARLSLLSQTRSDWIDNDYTGEQDSFGGHKEFAGRVQFLYTPTENFSTLLNYHARDLDGSQTAFRANIFDKGSNHLNENYDRDSVFYDGGDDNTQEYTGSGVSLNMNLQLTDMSITLISAYEEAGGTNTGDIDGGVAGVGPGFIPFSSETVDSGNVHQSSHEFRIANNQDNFWVWQLGGYYFNSGLRVFTDAGFNSATVIHENSSNAVFLHNTLNFENLIVSAGIRYTDDEKHFESPTPGISPIDINEGKESWDISATWLATDIVSFYARLANGFRAPSIQGRNVAFFGQPSVAKSEDAISSELGIKGDFLENSLRINAALFSYEIENYQLSAIGGVSNSNELLNANKGKGHGYETEISYLPTLNSRISLGYTYAKTEIEDSELATAVCGSGQCTVTDPLTSSGTALINGNPFPGAPKTSANLSLYTQKPTDFGKFYLAIDWIYFDEMNLALYESKEFIVGAQHEGAVRIGYRNNSDDLDVAIFARNVTDEDNVQGFVDFNNNTGFVNEPRIIGVEVKHEF